MRKRLKLAWRTLWGTYDGTPANPWPPKIAQMINFQDAILAVDSEGRIWRMRPDYDCRSPLLMIELLMENPVPKW